MSEMRLSDLILSVGTHRKDRPLSPSEVAQHLVYFRDQMGQERLLDRISLDQSTAQKFLKLLSLDPSVSNLVAFGRSPGNLSFSAAAELARISDRDDQKTIGFLAAQKMLTKDELRQVVQIHKRTDRDAQEVVDEIVGMRPSVEVTQIFLGSIKDPNLITELRDMTQGDRDRLFSGVLAGQGPTQGVQGRLQPETFSLVMSGSTPKTQLELLEDELNLAIGKAVKGYQ